MARFSANLGFLWRELSLCDAIHAANLAGFDAVECHWPYSTQPDEMNRALHEAGLPMLSLNVRAGDPAAGDFGLAALPGREDEARAAVDEALTYATSIHCPNVHFMSGITCADNAWSVYRDNLEYACQQARLFGINILIEAINTYDVPGYYLHHVKDAMRMIEEIAAPNLKLMFDCYHVQMMGDDLSSLISQHFDLIEHIQIAAFPGRGEPDSTKPDYIALLQLLDSIGYAGYIGAEYRPRGTTGEGLAWLARFRELSATST